MFCERKFAPNLACPTACAQRRKILCWDYSRLVWLLLAASSPSSTRCQSLAKRLGSIWHEHVKETTMRTLLKLSALGIILILLSSVGASTGSLAATAQATANSPTAWKVF